MDGATPATPSTSASFKHGWSGPTGSTTRNLKTEDYKGAAGDEDAQQRSAGAVDLVVAATAELQGLTLLRRDRDFECTAAVTGQALQWYGPEVGK